ncbi:MAG TPA: hypothetical protein VE422_08915 [Terriglobia bacterium]|nr:hypothetical protein [Terriglobia bacterium]
MTVCIAAMCEAGKRVVTATDGGITVAPIANDIAMHKWKLITFADHELLFLYAGKPGQADLIIEEFLDAANPKTIKKSRKALQDAVRKAFTKRYIDWIGERILFPWAMDYLTFKRTGRKFFGDAKFEQLVKEIEYTSHEEFNEQLLVVSWGEAPHSAIIFEVGRSGSSSHAGTGWIAIGSGAEVAMWTMLQLGQNRNSSLEETLYTVATAKFAAEQSEGVGRFSLSLTISRKRRSEETKPAAYVLGDSDLQTLRQLWEEYGKPRMPLEAIVRNLAPIVNSAGGQISQRTKIKLMRSAAKLKTTDPSSSPIEQ